MSQELSRQKRNKEQIPHVTDASSDTKDQSEKFSLKKNKLEEENKTYKGLPARKDISHTNTLITQTSTQRDYPGQIDNIRGSDPSINGRNSEANIHSNSTFESEIYRYVTQVGEKPQEIKMVGFNKAEVTYNNRGAANHMIYQNIKHDKGFSVHIPRRKLTRKGVIHEWEDSIKKLEGQLMEGQAFRRKDSREEVFWSEASVELKIYFFN
ncbi:uncharacterized protein LOC114881338 [Osmia bicornis bicornis]|uniref:uncharacterized protein LOC114881338 n=1 Tax=Osmia bicornis bicornis TaxID=1437191 RepID=UPI001EAEB0B4|nr:uncharacterized protein LOC114881338 [Osmia bicornis bicornis]